MSLEESLLKYLINLIPGLLNCNRNDLIQFLNKDKIKKILNAFISNNHIISNVNATSTTTTTIIRYLH